MGTKQNVIIGLISMCTVLLMVSIPAQAGEFPRLRAVVDRLGSGIHDLRGQQIQCDAERPIGVQIEAGAVAELLLDGMELRGCQIGVLAQTLSQLTIRGQHVMMSEAVAPQAITVAFWIEGGGSLIESNTILGPVGIGIYLAGPMNTVQHNTITGATMKAIYIVDHFNTVTGNIINGSGTGIHVYGNVPQNRPMAALFELAVPAQRNTISGNDVTCTAKNCVALWDSVRDCAGDPEEWFNVWSGNIVHQGKYLDANLDKDNKAPAECFQQ